MAEHIDPSLSELVLKSKSKIKRPPNAFMIFAREYRKSFASRNPKQDNKRISKMLGDTWKATDAKLKEKYFKMAKQLELLHKQKYPGYVYCPRTARLEKSKRLAKRARLRRSGDFKLRKTNMEPQEIRVKGVQELKSKEEEWIQEYDKWSSTTEYIPNNPEYFANPGEADNLSSSLLETSLSSDRSSELSPDPDYDPNEDLLRGVRSRKDNISPPILKPYWNEASPEDYVHTKRPEPDGFVQSSSPNQSYCLKQNMQNCYGNKYQTHYIPERHSFPWRPPLEIDHHCCQNVGYFPRVMNYDNSNLPRFHYNSDNLNHLYCMDCREHFHPLRHEYRHSHDITRLDLPPEFTHSYPSERTRLQLPPEIRHSPEIKEPDLVSDPIQSPKRTFLDLHPEFSHSFETGGLGLRSTPKTATLNLPLDSKHPTETKSLDLPPGFRRSPHVAKLGLSPEFQHPSETNLDLLSEFRYSSDAEKFGLYRECQSLPETRRLDFPPGFRFSTDTTELGFPSEFNLPLETASFDLRPEFKRPPDAAGLDLPPGFKHPSETTILDLSPRFRHPSENQILDLSSNSKHSLEATTLDVPLSCYPTQVTESTKNYSTPVSSDFVGTRLTNITMNVKFEMPSEVQKQEGITKNFESE